MGNERRDDADQHRADVHGSALIGGATAFTLVLVVVLALDVVVPGDDISPGAPRRDPRLPGVRAPALWRE